MRRTCAEDQHEDGVYSPGISTSGISVFIQGELKTGKIEELVKNIPNSISNNKDSLDVLTIKKLKLRYNPKSLLTGKIISRITNYNEIPL
jgi:hypothetical protein